MVSMAIGTYAYMFGKELSNYHLTYIMISLFIIFVTIITFVEGTYKSQGFLIQFHSKDEYFNSTNDRFYISWQL